MTLNDRKMKAMRAARASALRQAVTPETKDYEARASQAACMVMLSLRPAAERAARARIDRAAKDSIARMEGNDARCTECDTYFNRDEDFTCPQCECQFHWPI
jgi:Zn finger protein HypA/HybF involved in hydrogenase expression